MADYSKQTVANLRQLLKDRGIPSTGLTRKAQIIEKLEETDAAGDGHQEAGNATEEAAPTAPTSEHSKDGSSQEDDVPSLPLEAAGGMRGQCSGAIERADASLEPKQTAAELQAQREPTPVPAPTADRSPETISHIESEIPPPNDLKAIEQPAEDTTAEEEVGGPQPTEVFRTAPAAPEDDQVGPHITEPTDEEMEVKAKDKDKEAVQDELPEAPGPAAEALRLAQDTAEETQDTAMEVETPSPAPNERDTVEKPELLPIPERSTAETSRLNTEELEADTRKRKRRSNSPDPTSKEILAKKPRPSEEPAPDVHLAEDDDIAMEQRRPDSSSGPNQDKKVNTSRYKDLAPPSSNQPPDALNDDRPTIPAIHPVTSALYIRNFMRPLRPDQLRTHLTSLATPPSSSPDPSVLSSLFLDNMKTHALALFTSPTAASRVRASLHGAIWPPEGNRKELWVDFIPAELVVDWIQTEEAALAAEKDARTAGRPIAAKRFEVIYSDGPDGVVAVHQEVGTGAGAPAHAPRGPRATTDTQFHHSPHVPAPPIPDLKKDSSAPFKTLHDLFASTTAKPSLFFLPVSDAVAESRLKELDAETSREWDPEAVRRGRGLQKEGKFRYTFDEGEGIVEMGEDRGPWVGDVRGGRGGARGRGAGGWRGRGGGGGWRG
ncbi:sap domain-containing protein [Stagonosporopsis vannaccii]|nr:sap domain-containing protein [Stagonosporopsis vannaccii]